MLYGSQNKRDNYAFDQLIQLWEKRMSARLLEQIISGMTKDKNGKNQKNTIDRIDEYATKNTKHYILGGIKIDAKTKLESLDKIPFQFKDMKQAFDIWYQIQSIFGMPSNESTVKSNASDEKKSENIVTDSVVEKDLPNIYQWYPKSFNLINTYKSWKTKDTLLVCLIENNEYQCVNKLLRNKVSNIIIPLKKSNANDKEKEVKDCLEIAVSGGCVEIFINLVNALLEQNNVGTWNELIELGVVNANSIDRLWDCAIESNNSNMKSLLLNAKELGMDIAISLFNLLHDNTGNNETFSANFAYYQKDEFIATYLFNHLDKSALDSISNVIDKGLKDKTCGFNDSLLLLANKINSKQFKNTIEQCTKDCLSNDLKDDKKYHFFKNNLLNSNIWSVNTANSILFETINTNVINKELEKQKEFIKNSIVLQEKQFNESWNKLLNFKNYCIGIDNQITQNKLIIEDSNNRGDDINLMKEKGIKPDYRFEELPMNNVNAFDAPSEYDFNGYLTKLLIATHQIDPIFQENCSNIFKDISKKKNISNYQFTSAPPKTKQRCVRKAYLEYSNDREWPYTSSIVDLVRCSVVFDTVDDLLNAVNTFEETIINENENNNVIKKVVRRKNGFYRKIQRESWNMQLSLFDYCDIKLNVIIEYFDIQIIGEIQFLLEFMLMAKKKGHSIYGFIRNEDYFKQLNQISNDENQFYLQFQKIILLKNIKQFSSFLQNCSNKEKSIVEKQKDKLILLIKQNQWKKGLKLFHLFVNTWHSLNLVFLLCLVVVNDILTVHRRVSSIDSPHCNNPTPSAITPWGSIAGGLSRIFKHFGVTRRGIESILKARRKR